MARKLNNDSAIRIAAAAKQEFAKRGFAGARVERIARAAGVNKQLLFYYFQSKRGLFQAAVRRAMSELEAALASSAQLSGRPLDRLRQLLTTLYEFLEQHPDLRSEERRV